MASSQDDLDFLLYRFLETPQGRQNPYPFYDVFRAYGRPFKSSLGVSIFSTYHDCSQALRDQRFGHGPRPEKASVSYPSSLAPVMLESDPPDHTRLRRVVSGAFSPQHSRDNYLSTVQQVVSDVFDGVSDDNCDVLADIALEVPPRVISKILGLGDGDHTSLIPHIRTSISAIDRAVVSKDDGAVLESVQKIQQYFSIQIEERRHHPRRDLLTGLVHARDVESQLSEGELLSTVLLLFVAGYESTANLISNLVWVLVQNPWLWRDLRNNPAGIGTMIQEVLRWESPVQLVGRSALKSTEVNGVLIEAGEQVMVLLGSANRDESIFVDASEFRPRRQGPQPLSFSSGIHYCLGAPLAKMEAEVILREMLNRYGGMKATADNAVTFRSNLVLRGVDGMKVSFR